MRALLAGCLILCACTADSFVGNDGGPDAAGEAGNDRDGASDASMGDGHAEDVFVQDVISTGDASGTEASAPAYVQCDQTNTQQCTAQTEVCCGNTDWTGSSCTPNSGCSSVGAHPLACDDMTDCSGGNVCCASVLTTSSLLVVSSSCQSTCVTPQTQLCRGSAECKSGTCQALPNGSTPSWLEHCQ